MIENKGVEGSPPHSADENLGDTGEEHHQESLAIHYIHHPGERLKGDVGGHANTKSTEKIDCATLSEHEFLTASVDFSLRKNIEELDPSENNSNRRENESTVQGACGGCIDGHGATIHLHLGLASNQLVEQSQHLGQPSDVRQAGVQVPYYLLFLVAIIILVQLLIILTFYFS